MKKYGLIGKPLGHSWSQQWFESMFACNGITDVQYRPYELDSIESLRDLVYSEEINGFNVTIPYKETVISYLDLLDGEARAIGAVNCVERCGNLLIGHNTDASAFRLTLEPLLQSHHASALILGSGGAAKAVAYALRQIGIDYTIVSRQPQLHSDAISYSDARILASSHFLIINTTPVGMSPCELDTPWPHVDMLDSTKHLCYDLIYNPLKTRFLLDAEQMGVRTINGLSMLECQAQLSWNIWSQQT